jgi:hypothetical protein
MRSSINQTPEMKTRSISESSPLKAGIRRLALAAALAAAAAAGNRASAQGCVAIHGSGISAGEDAATDSSDNMNLIGAPGTDPWAMSIDYRYFNSLHDYIGTHENGRIGTGVFNKSDFTDFGLTYLFDPRWSVTLELPFVVNDRSQETNGLRYHTDAVGIGDTSIEGNYWVFDPQKHPKGNILLGLGMSLPTGNDRAMGTFLTYNKADNAYLAKEEPVDQSIQPGTGGWDGILDLYLYRQVGVRGVNFYGSATYQFVPFQDTNGTPTYRSNPFEAITGITDSYLYRAGFEYQVLPQYGVTVSWGARMEGVPVRNWFGDSAGFRRPGYSIDWEPGVTWTHKTYSFRLYVPFAIMHDRTQSLADQEYGAETGTYMHGDAFFANYEIIAGFSKKL